MRLLRRAIPALFAILIAAGATSSAPGDPIDVHPPKETSALSALIWASGPEMLPRIDQSGRILTPALLRDKVVVLAFVSPDCLITCVVRTLALAKLADDLPADIRARTAFLAVSVAPGRDDAAALRRFAEGLRIGTEQLRLVTGDAAVNAAMVAALRYPADKLPEPPPTVVVFDRRGQMAMTYGSAPLDGPRLLRDIALLDTFEDGVGHPPRNAAAAAAP